MINRLALLVAAIGGAVLATVLAPGAAWAEKRVALVVGNSSYQTVPQLPNPARDASSVAKMFREAGFDTVETELNVGNLEFKRAIRRFEATADQSDIAVVYYAGHGLEIGGVNYLIPVDARLASDRDADDESILLERLVSSADGARRLRLIILDACRDNPFVTTMKRERKMASRAVIAGLGKVEPTSTDTLIAYAAKAGSTADDGAGDHSPFTAAVLKNLTVPGLDVRLAFGRVRDEVLKATGNRQEPFVYGSLGGGTISLVPAPATRQEAPVSDIKADYELVQKIGSKRAWEVFLGTHPSGFYADLARAHIETINADAARTQLASLPQQPSPGRETPSPEVLAWDRVKDSSDIAALQLFIKRFPDAPLSINAQQRIELLSKAAQEREEQARAAREAARKAQEEVQRQAEARKAELAAQRKREADERRAREAEAAEKARVAAAEAAAAKKREEDERRAKALEAEQKAKAEQAERKAAEAKARAERAERERLAAEAAAQKAAAEKQARALEAEEKARAQEAERKAAEERREVEAEAAAARAAAEKQVREAEEAKAAAERAERERLAAETAAQKAAAEKQTRILEAEQKAKAQEAERKATEERRKVEAEAAVARAAAEKQAREAAEAKAATERAERERLAAEAAAQKAAEKQAKALEAEQKAKAQEAERKAAEEKRKVEAEAAAARAAAEKQAREAEEARKKAELAAAREAACKSEQGKLEDIARKGSDGTGLDDLKAFAKTVTCDRLGSVVVATLDRFKTEAAKRAAAMPNSPELIRSAQSQLIRLGCLTGKVDGTLNPPTSAALSRYMKIEGQPSDNVSVTETVVSELTRHVTRVCPIECKAGETLKGETCVAEEKAKPPAVAAKPKRDEDDVPRKQQASRPSERAKAAATPEAPRARQQAVARPSIVSGGRSGGHSTIIGIGF